MLTKEEKDFLLGAARNAIQASVTGHRELKFPDCPEVLRRPSGAFVSIHEHGELRGCIGYIQALKPLIDTVAEAAEKAALEDPRFMPVREDELDELKIEISVLSPLQKIRDTDGVEVGTHGLLVESGRCRGLLLPQVATDFGWDRETFLSQTCRKAGLPADAWKDRSTTISVFTAEVFGEGHTTNDTRTR